MGVNVLCYGRKASKRASRQAIVICAPATTFKIDGSNWGDKENNTNVIISFSRCQRMETYVKFVIFTFECVCNAHIIIIVVVRMHCTDVGCVYLCQKAQHKINRSHIIRLLSTPKHIPFACSLSLICMYIQTSLCVWSHQHCHLNTMRNILNFGKCSIQQQKKRAPRRLAS